MKTLLSLLLFILSFTCTAQVANPAMRWLKGYGGNGFDGCGSFVTNTNDNGFIVGIGSNSNFGTGNIDSFCKENGEKTIYFKYNKNASILEWTRCTHNGTIIYPLSDSIFVSGGITTAAAFGWAFKFLKEDFYGNVLLYKKYGDSASAILRGMAATTDGNYVLAGEFYYADSDFTTQHGGSDIGIIKVDTNGNKLWSKVIGSSGFDAVAAVIAGLNSDCYVVGGSATADYDFAASHGNDEIYLERFDAKGNSIWRKMIGGSGGEYSSCAFPNGKGGVIIAGASNSRDGDNTATNDTFVCPIWVLEVDSNGTIIWNNCFGGGGGNCYPKAVCKATDGSVWVAGVSSKPGWKVDTNYGKDDAYFVHMDSTGHFLSAKVVGSTQDDNGMMIYPLSDGGVIAGGIYDRNNGAFTSLKYYGNTDAFLLTFSTNLESIGNNKLLLPVSIFPNPAQNKLHINISNSMYCIIIENTLGVCYYTNKLYHNAEIDISSWQAGIYYVHFIDGYGYKYIQKLVKQ